MLFLIRFFPEVIIKSRPVRRRFIRQLRRNLRSLLTELDPQVEVTGDWDFLEVKPASQDPELSRQMLDVLRNTPGISLIMRVRKIALKDFDGILEEVRSSYADRLPGRTFAVRCNRQGRHSFRSVDVERYLGAELLRDSGARGVDLGNPEVTVRLDIRQNELLVVEDEHRGLGGYPLGTQDPVLSLMSGGFDSAVSSFHCIRRGLLTHFLFFNLGGKEHEVAVKEVALYLWMRFGASQRVKFISVPFEEVVEEILTSVDNSQMGVILKRLMFRAADQVAEEMGVQALATGESVAQVSSQTLANLSVIDEVTNKLVLRPLVTTDKQEIIDVARRIGTEQFSKSIPEYCGVISLKPTTRARRHRIEREEAGMDPSVVDRAVENREVQLIDRLVEGLGHDAVEPDEYPEVPEGATVLDIRHPDEVELQPLDVPGADVRTMPFYQLHSAFGDMDADRQYLLYCDKGMMSRLHASHLKDAGHDNVAVYRPR